MKLLKAILLCSAAGALWGGAAQAADLPVKKAAAAAVAYVETCPLYGSAFLKLPGTDICMQMRGGLESKLSYHDARTAVKENGKSLVVTEGAANTTGWMLKIKPGWDFRSPTEYGTLRTFFALKTEVDNGIHEDRDPVLTGKMSVKMDKAFIEWAGFLVGMEDSQFGYWTQDDVILSIGGGPKFTTVQLTYFWKLGNGTKASIGIEDQGDDLAAELSDLDGGVEGLNGVELGLGPSRTFAVVASLTTEQSWGDAKLAAIINPIQTFSSVHNPGGTPDHRETTYGWGVLGGITFNLPMLGKKDQLMLQGTYCDGVTTACLDKDLTRMDDKGFYPSGLQRKDYDAFALANANGWDLATTKITSVAAQLRHYWAPLWRTNLSGSMSWVETPAIAKTFDLADGGLGNAHGWDAALNLIWGEKRKTAEIGVEVVYKSLQQDLPGSGTIKYAGPYEKDPAGWAVASWIKRSW